VSSSSSSTPPPSEAEQIEQLKKQLQWAELKIQVLEERLRLELIAKYGPASEKLNDAQLELLQWEPGVSNVEVQAESEREAEAAGTDKPHKRKHPGRQELPADLPRREKVLACTPEQCTCRACGQQTTVIGYDQSEQLDVEPARYFVLVTKREKRVCQFCQEGGIATAPLATRIIDKGLASDRVVIDAVVAKYSDPFAVVPSERDFGAGDRARDQPRHAGWMGHASG
jgi:transposase